MTEHTGNTSLFALFAFSIYTLLVAGFTIYQCCSGSDEDAGQSWVKAKQKKTAWTKLLDKLTNKANLTTIVLWIVWALMLFYVQKSIQELKPFNPYEILDIDVEATASEIKKAYFKLSKQYHPDKNPDPAAEEYFANFISKAYQALTDETARDNWKKHGHPDGPQPINMGVALPEWLFSKDRRMAPLMLLVLVGCGILLPLSVISWYMLSSDQYEGPNRIMKGTYYNYLAEPKSCIKESMGLARLPDTLVTAVEFIQLPTFADQEATVEDLWRAIMHAYPEYKDKKHSFWRRKGSVLKAHLLLLAHLERQDDISPALKQDLTFVLQKSPILLEEIFKLACSPRPPYGYGWMTPAISALEMLQCVVQGVPTKERKPQGRADSAAVLLQLPHMDSSIAKALRNKCKIKQLKDLQELGSKERREALVAAGMSEEQAEDADTFASALPALSIAVQCDVDGEDTFYEQEIIKCTATVTLTRPNHADRSKVEPAKTVRALAPHFQLPYDESWYFVLVDTSSNWVLTAREKVSLVEAEVAGFETREASQALVPAGKAVKSEAETKRKSKAGDETPAGQVVEMMFMAPKAGKYDFTLLAMSDCYIGCDVSTKVTVRVLPQTRAMQEGRETRPTTSKQITSREEEDKAAKKEEAADDDEDDEGEDEDEDEDEDGSEDEYDSEESGEEETDDEQ